MDFRVVLILNLDIEKPTTRFCATSVKMDGIKAIEVLNNKEITSYHKGPTTNKAMKLTNNLQQTAKFVFSEMNK
jgi:hypothetical protein